MVPGGFDVMSRATRLTPSTSLMMREDEALEQVVGQPGPVGGHGVVGGDGPDDDGVGVGAPVAHDPDGAHGGEHGEALPQLAVEAGPADLLDHDGVGGPQDLGPLGGDLADDAHGQAGPGEGLAPHDLVGQAELLAHGPHLVLEQQAQGLDQVEGQVLGQPAHVVVRLDGGRVAGPRLDDVGVQRALDEEAAAVAVLPQPSSPRPTSSKIRMKSLADDLALGLGVGDARPGRRRTGRPPSRG